MIIILSIILLSTSLPIVYYLISTRKNDDCLYQLYDLRQNVTNYILDQSEKELLTNEEYKQLRDSLKRLEYVIDEYKVKRIF